MTRRSVSGPFTIRQVGDGAWQLSTGAPHPLHIHLYINGSSAAPLLQDLSLRRLEFEWHDSGVTVTMTRETGTTRAEAVTVILHEPPVGLYQRLPLAEFDAKARRFWTRVFWLTRVPGGRLLLAAIARRGR